MFSIYIIFEFCFRVANSFVMNPLMASRGKKVFKKETIHQDLKSKYKMIPVHKDAFGKFNELTESLQISRAVQKNPGDCIIFSLLKRFYSVNVEITEFVIMKCFLFEKLRNKN